MSAADDVRQVDRVGGDGFQGFDEPGAFTRTRCIFMDRLISREGPGDSSHHFGRFQHVNICDVAFVLTALPW
jgi:hypothetical protein